VLFAIRLGGFHQLNEDLAFLGRRYEKEIHAGAICSGARRRIYWLHSEARPQNFGGAIDISR
jgi:hypothetical protein